MTSSLLATSALPKKKMKLHLSLHLSPGHRKPQKMVDFARGEGVVYVYVNDTYYVCLRVVCVTYCIQWTYTFTRKEVIPLEAPFQLMAITGRTWDEPGVADRQDCFGAEVLLSDVACNSFSVLCLDRWANEPLLVGGLSHQAVFFVTVPRVWRSLTCHDGQWWLVWQVSMALVGKNLANPGTWGLWGSTFHLCQWHEGGAWMDDGRCSYFFFYIHIITQIMMWHQMISPNKKHFSIQGTLVTLFFLHFFSWLVFKYEEFVHSIHLLLLKNSKQPQLDWVGDRFLVYRFIGRAEYYHVGLKNRYIFSVYRKNNRDE